MARSKAVPVDGLQGMVTTRELKLGHFIIEFATPGIGWILKHAGVDFALLDMEHSGFGFETVKSVLVAMQAADLPTIVRVPSGRYDHIARAADVGAEGIMVPMVGSADEARMIVDHMTYPPAGRRGVALGITHDRYQAGPVLEKLEAANRKITFFAQIETASGVDNADAIAAIPGVDALWIGHFDLSCSIGVPGDFGHERFVEATRKVASAARAHGKALGRLVPSIDEGIAYRDMGFDLICYSGDVWALQQAVSSGVAAIRGAKTKGAETDRKPVKKTKSKAGKTKRKAKKS